MTDVRKPMMGFPVRERYPESDRRVLDGILEVLSQDVTSNGPRVAEFEARLCRMLRARHCIAVSSATSGLLLAVKATQPRGWIGVPAFGFPATALAATWSVAKINFLDANAATFNVSLPAFERAVAESTQPSCMITLAVAGNLTGLKELYSLARAREIPVVVDAASCLGLTSDRLTDYGDLVVLSFSSKKALPICEGGVVMTESDFLAQRLRSLRTYGYRVQNGFEVEHMGLNARLSEVHAAIGLSLLPESAEVISKRNSVAGALRSRLSATSGISLQKLDDNQLGTSEIVFRVPLAVRESVMRYLRHVGIDAVPFYSPALPFHEALQGFGSSAGTSFPQAVALSHECVGIKTFSTWSQEHIEFVATAIEAALRLN